MTSLMQLYNQDKINFPLSFCRVLELVPFKSQRHKVSTFNLQTRNWKTLWFTYRRQKFKMVITSDGMHLYAYFQTIPNKWDTPSYFATNDHSHAINTINDQPYKPQLYHGIQYNPYVFCITSNSPWVFFVPCSRSTPWKNNNMCYLSNYTVKDYLHFSMLFLLLQGQIIPLGLCKGV